MSEPENEPPKEKYIGDGVYASYDGDYYVRLRAPPGPRRPADLHRAGRLAIAAAVHARPGALGKARAIKDC